MTVVPQRQNRRVGKGLDVGGDEAFVFQQQRRFDRAVHLGPLIDARQNRFEGFVVDVAEGNLHVGIGQHVAEAGDVNLAGVVVFSVAGEGREEHRRVPSELEDHVEVVGFQQDLDVVFPSADGRGDDKPDRRVRARRQLHRLGQLARLDHLPRRRHAKMPAHPRRLVDEPQQVEDMLQQPRDAPPRVVLRRDGRIHAEFEQVQPRVAQRQDASVVQKAAVGVEAQEGVLGMEHRDDVFEFLIQRRLAAGEVDLVDAQTVDGVGQVPDFLGEHALSRPVDHPIGRAFGARRIAVHRHRVFADAQGRAPHPPLRQVRQHPRAERGLFRQISREPGQATQNVERSADAHKLSSRRAIRRSRRPDPSWR